MGAANNSGTVERRLERVVARLERRLVRLQALSLRYSRVRLALFLTGAAMTFALYQVVSSPAAWGAGLAAAALFILVVRRHDRILASIRRHELYRDIKAAHIARIRRDWEAIEPPSAGEAPPEHPFGRDLDLAGPRSLHHLLDTSFTEQGSRRLRDWLLAETADPVRTRARQDLVRELVPMTPFMDRLALLSALASRPGAERWDGEVLLSWLNRKADSDRIRPVLLVLFLLAAVNLVLLVVWLVTSTPAWWLLSLTLYAAVYLLNSRLYSHLFDEAEHLYDRLSRFRPIMLFLERYSLVPGSRLERLCGSFRSGDQPASSYLARATRLAMAASTQKSEVLRLVLNVLLPWDLLFSSLLARYKQQLRDRLPGWLDAVHELEAASSLAMFAALHPEYAFPEILAGDGAAAGPSELESTEAAPRPPESAPRDAPALLEAAGIGHPLLPEEQKVRNDFRIEGLGNLTLVTGSNMSGKSTFLRTIGSNVCLALAGAPVDARSMSTGPWRVFTCINVIDSVNDGISHFYAEVRRLRRLQDAIRQRDGAPLLYLVDEIFRGTNNRERLIGSRALLLDLLKRRGSGLVTTHDLELAALENEAEGIRNRHFRETIAEGRMVFDYAIREGPSPTTNALHIMKLEGLPVDPRAGAEPETGAGS